MRYYIKWMIVVLYIGLIYGTSGIARDILNGVKSVAGGGFSGLVNFLVVGLLMGFLIFARKQIWRFFQQAGLRTGSAAEGKRGVFGKASGLWLLGLVLVGYGTALVWLDVPEERVHLIQYGLLAFLIYRAWPDNMLLWKRHCLTFCLVFLAGVGDEWIQWLRPNRVGDMRDVLINAISGLLAQGILLLKSFCSDNENKRSSQSMP